MCGRFALHHSTEEVAHLFAVDHIAMEIQPRYNIAPGQPVLAVVQHDRRSLQAFRWGLVPSWAKDARIGNRMINARAETLGEKPAFRAAFRRRRCLIPASGFYEWRKTGARRQPLYIRSRDGHVLALAGLWEEWLSPDGEPLRTCTIVTTAANEPMASIHPRMPVILAPAAWTAWLASPVVDPAAQEQLQHVLELRADDDLTAYPVSLRVNAPGHDDPACIEPIAVGTADAPARSRG